MAVKDLTDANKGKVAGFIIGIILLFGISVVVFFKMEEWFKLAGFIPLAGCAVTIYYLDKFVKDNTHFKKSNVQNWVEYTNIETPSNVSASLSNVSLEVGRTYAEFENKKFLILSGAFPGFLATKNTADTWDIITFKDAVINVVSKSTATGFLYANKSANVTVNVDKQIVNRDCEITWNPPAACKDGKVRTESTSFIQSEGTGKTCEVSYPGAIFDTVRKVWYKEDPCDIDCEITWSEPSACGADGKKTTKGNILHEQSGKGKHCTDVYTGATFDGTNWSKIESCAIAEKPAVPVSSVGKPEVPMVSSVGKAKKEKPKPKPKEKPKTAAAGIKYMN